MASTSAIVTPRQNWVISPIPDLVFIIAAPLLGLAWTLAIFYWLGEIAVITIFTGFNVAHHLPTFIRIYGDKRLMERFRWSLLLGPVIPFSAYLLLSLPIILHPDRYTLEYVGYITIILTLWDPWHFLMQHYGFMRIYDRHNHAPRPIAARMDLLLCATWFVHIMIATMHWLPDLIYDFYRLHGVPLLHLLDSGGFAIIEAVSLVLAVAATFAYLIYLVWCRNKGYFISYAKLWLLTITFGIMYLTYVPNQAMRSFVPNWSFAMGFAALGMVHVSQYLAIVWKYNRGLARDPQKARQGLFASLFARGGFLIGAAYVLVCLSYGFGLSFNRFVSGPLPIPLILLVFFGGVNFTSTFLHYYYDGFIWKVRHKENREALMEDGSKRAGNQAAAAAGANGESGSRSWWDGTSVTGTAAHSLLRQAAYFLPPIVLVAGTFWLMRTKEIESAPLQHLERIVNSKLAVAEAMDPRDPQVKHRALLAQEDAAETLAAIDRQIQIERRMNTVRERALHHIYMAELFANRASFAVRSQHLINPQSANSQAMSDAYSDLKSAVDHYQQALACEPPYTHREHRSTTGVRLPPMSREEVRQRRAELQSTLDRSLQTTAASRQPPPTSGPGLTPASNPSVKRPHPANSRPES